MYGGWVKVAFLDCKSIGTATGDDDRLLTLLAKSIG
jgi:hypothetical protein